MARLTGEEKWENNGEQGSRKVKSLEDFKCVRVEGYMMAERERGDGSGGNERNVNGEGWQIASQTSRGITDE